MNNPSSMLNTLQIKAKRLSDLVSGLGVYSEDVWVHGVSDDTRTLKAGDAFLCLPRVKDVPARWAEAQAKGAVAVLLMGAQSAQQHGLACAWLPNLEAVGVMLRRWFDTEDINFPCIGITGTDGKTSTTWMLREVLALQCGSAWSCGTLGWVRDEQPALDLGNTTPSLLTLHKILALGKAQGIGALVLEVSSHGISQQRIAGLPFAAAIWTTLGEDHLQDHGGLAPYIAAKASFVLQVAKVGGVVVANHDYADIRLALAEQTQGVFWYAKYDADAQQNALLWQSLNTGLRLVDHTTQVALKHVPVADFHAENLAAVALLMKSLMAMPLPSFASLVDGNISTPLGRLEPVVQGESVFIDYAHTAEGLARCLHSARRLCQGKLLLVFGCGGDRDKAKRPVMGEVAVRLADECWLTSDNPRSEMQSQIAHDVLMGVPQAWLSAVHVSEDRKLSIFQAVAAMAEADVLVIAGKGHESYMEVQGARMPWSDKQVALLALAAVGVK